MNDLNVLVVEDDDRIRRLLVEYLTQQGPLHVEAARDGVEALHQLSTRHYDVMVLDLMMPKMSGIDLLESMRAMRSDPSVQSLDSAPAVFVVTGSSRELLPDGMMEKRFPEAVRRVFRKPVDIIDLSKAIVRTKVSAGSA